MSSDRLYVNKSLHEISSHLIQLNTNLTQKIEGRNVKLAGEIQRIDTSFGTEVETLKTSHEEIRRSLQDHQARTENLEKECHRGLQNGVEYRNRWFPPTSW